MTTDGNEKDSVLDDPVGASLRGAHAHLARRRGEAFTYQGDVATFAALPAAPDAAAWAELAALLGPGELADLFSSPATPPRDWEPVFSLDGLQLTGPVGGEQGSADESGVVELGPADVPDMLALVERTRPGPFRPRTHELGTYLGVRAGGSLVALAGERLRPPGWTEISAVCTAPEARGRGHAARLVRALSARIEARGERPFLHVAASNTAAVTLYERLGFEVRRPVTFRGFRVPGA
ncbi:GNAT family N-acetyltransferase [Streptomyces xanthii]|uniref:GNAT family N-acetyltransferase n=1 Tax=Streptomyces xanthii TaxID=2768069 RepID=A0A7H1BIP3_9ACTN|nr:GNAT family N-acetyltransferase [Streptomyces xanthii]QNS08598.1 GNAT family N-acetyltransferase [Streptomyces xanthii]